MTDFWAEILTFCQQTTQSIGSQLLQEFGQLQATAKSDGSLVTKADHWADQQLREAIAAKFPEHGVLTEETTHIFPDQDWCWIIDPIDGTTNFTRGLPLWGISLGLAYQGMPVFGFVYLPSLRQSYYGYWYGDTGLSGPTGAYCNDKPISTSKDQPSRNHLFNLCARSLKILQNPFPCKIRMIGVASYNILLVAQGVALGGVEATPKVWDMAAVWVILKAAGGSFVFLRGEPLFPLTTGKNYGQEPFTCLATSQAALVPIFQPLVDCIVKK
ncbi:MAG: inositol monophosphatase family protein [Microcystaceae cyanobacterium]